MLGTTSSSAARRDVADVEHVYVHIPFCAQRCSYCGFNTYAGRDDEIEDYLHALRVEARASLRPTGLKTLYVGGGTPTYLPVHLIARTLAELRSAAGEAVGEFTVEANPGSLGRDTVDALRGAGVNRVSFGAQTFNARHLRTLGRIHDATQIERSFDALRAGGIEQISLDLILAIPGQTRTEQAHDLSRATALAPDHISAYVLEIEKGTPFECMVEDGRIPPPDDDRELGHLRIAVAQLAVAGYARYEVSNFARPGLESQHNLAYWRDRNWVGLGAGAHSHIGRERWKNLDDPAAYTEAVYERGAAVDWVEASDLPTALFEALMMGLRLAEGVDLDELTSRFDIDLRTALPYRRALEEHRNAGRLTLDGSRLRLTERGMELASRILESFLPDDV